MPGVSVRERRVRLSRVTNMLRESKRVIKFPLLRFICGWSEKRSGAKFGCDVETPVHCDAVGLGSRLQGNRITHNHWQYA